MAETETEATWGVVATIKAPAPQILRFAAHHLDLGARRVHIYLDEPNPEVLPYLEAHPKIKVTVCTDGYWQNQRNRDRPEGHQHRQTMNATHAYYRAQVDWLAHIDVDEFLWSQDRISAVLGALPSDAGCARVLPLESLPGPENLYKAAVPRGPGREDRVRSIYPAYGGFLRGGFMSHVAGKLFARTGRKKTRMRIHNIIQDDVSNPGMQELPGVDLCHHHSEDWETWLEAYRYRILNGSYRPSLGPDTPRQRGGLTKHELLTMVEEDGGEAGLKRFYDEISAQDTEVFEKLQQAGLIHKRVLNLEDSLRKHFPGLN